MKGSDNKICDALSILCTKVCLDSNKYVSRSPKLLQTCKRAAIRNKQLETEDPVVMKIAEEANMDLECLEMLNNIENDTETQDIPVDNKVRQLLNLRNRMSVVTLDAIHG